MNLATAKGLTGSYEELCNNKQMKILLLTELNALGRKQGLNGF